MTFWTEDEDAIVLDMWEGVCSSEAIANVINARCGSQRTHNSVIGRAYRLALRKRTTGPRSATGQHSHMRHPTKAQWIEAAAAEAETAAVELVPLLAGAKSRAFVPVRWRAWQRLHGAGFSLSGIGHIAGFDHTSVRHGLIRLAELHAAKRAGERG